jgi:hypothetical protein
MLTESLSAALNTPVQLLEIFGIPLLVTLASVALANSFFVFLYPHIHDFTTPGPSIGQFGSKLPPPVLTERSGDHMNLRNGPVPRVAHPRN